MTIRYEFCDVWPNDGMWDHPTPSIPREVFDGDWPLDAQHRLSDEEAMRPIVDAAMREDRG